MKIINYQASHQVQQGMATAKRLAKQQKTAQITTDQMLLAFAQTRDAGAAVLLADHGASYFHMRDELKGAKYVDHHLTEDELNEKLAADHFNNPYLKKVINSPLQLIHEDGQHTLALVDRTYQVSDFVYHAFQYAQSLVAQQTSPTIQTRALLLGVIDEAESNGFALLFKLLCLYKNIYPQRSTDLFQDFDYWHGSFQDGILNNEKQEQEAHDALLSQKLKRADYSILQDYGVDLTDLAKQQMLPPLIGRHQEVKHLELVLNRRSKRNALLLGPAGAGKTAIVEGLAQRIASGEIPTLKGKKLIEIPTEKLAALLLDMYSFSAFARLIEELHQRQDVILYLDEIANLRLLGGQGLINMLKPALARGEIQVIGSTTYLEAGKFFAGDEALQRRFESINVPPLSRKQTDQVMMRASIPYENFYGLNYTQPARQAAVDLADKLIKFPLPDSALTLLDTAGAMVLAKKGQQAHSITDYQHRYHDLTTRLAEAKQKSLNEQEVNQLITQLATLTKRIAKAKNDKVKHHYQAKVSVTQIVKAAELVSNQPIDRATLQSFKKRRQVAKLDIFSLADRMKQHVIGQDAAIDQLAKALLVAHAKLGQANTPIGAFFFAGLTGVGKTETAKQLAIEEFGTANALTRFNMADYSTVIGSDQSFSNDLYQAVLSHPRGVILLDEYEKAAPNVSNVLLSVLDDGSFHPQSMVQPSFDQTIFIITSNIGAQSASHVGFGEGSTASDSQAILNSIHQYYAPEFLNRLDAICIFNQLTGHDLRQITDLLLKKEQRQLKNRGFSLSWTPAVVDWLVKHYANAKYGARPLERGIKQAILTRLAPPLIRGDVKKGSSLALTIAQNQIQLAIK